MRVKKWTKKSCSLILTAAMLITTFVVSEKQSVIATDIPPVYDVKLDFEDANKGAWSGIADSELEIVADSDNAENHVLKINSTEHDQYVLNTAVKAKNGSVSFRFKPTTERGGDRKYGFVFHGQEEVSNPAFMYTPAAGRWNLYYPTVEDSAQNTGVELNVNAWNDVEIICQDTTYTLKINGQVANETTKEGYPSEGFFGFKFADGDLALGDVYIDDFQVHAEDPTKVVELKFDDENAGNWKNITSENMAVVEDPENADNKVLKFTTTNHDQYVVNGDAPAFANGKMTFKFYSTVASGEPYAFAMRNPGTGESIAFVQTPTPGKWNFYNAETNTSSVVEGKAHLEKDKWNDVEITFFKNQFKVVINGETYFEQEVDAQKYPEEAGFHGFKFVNGEKNQTFYIDDFRLYNWDTEPDDTLHLTITPDAGNKTEADLRGKLWYNQPSANWETESLPIGNGTLGGMTFGKVDVEEIQLNELTMWDGGPNSKVYTPYNKVDSAKYVEQFKNEYYGQRRQSELIRISNQLTGNENTFGAYQTYGKMLLDMGLTGQVTAENYRRELDLNNAVQNVRYTIDGVDYSREYFVSYPDDVMVIRMTATGKDNLKFTLSNQVDDSASYVSQAQGLKGKTYTTRVEGSSILTEGTINVSDIDFASEMKVIAPNANVTANDDNSITVENGETAVILVSIKTDYANENDQFNDPNAPPDYKDGSNPLDTAKEVIKKASAKVGENADPAALKQAHVDDYRELFDRADIRLGDGACSTLPTDELVRVSSDNKDRDSYIDELLFRYGRYLLISSSRDGELSANLQGLWSDSNMPDWNSDFHYNVNIQMIYWPAYITNLHETAIPLIKQVASLETPGKTTAKEYHGVEDGFVFHMKTNAFGYTAPGKEFSWGWSPGSSSWILQNLWEYYEFTNDEAMLRDTIYPLMKANARFWLKNLVEDKETGDMVSLPSYSPEQGPRSVGTTFDQELVWQLFTDVLTASEVVGTPEDEALWAEIKEVKEKLNPLQIGDSGQIKEWREEGTYNHDQNGNRLPGTEDYHRHVSQLLGLYPGKHITTETPEYLEAAKKSLKLRGKGGSGWGKAHKINLWARADEAEGAYDILTSFIAEKDPRPDNNNGGIYANLLCAHPPYQMDGNEGATSGIAEMLLQSQSGYIAPLAALPQKWADGSFKGLMARNNFEVSADWANSELLTMSIKSNSGKECKINYDGIDAFEITDSAGEKVDFNSVERGKGQKISFDTKAGEVYTFSKDTEAKVNKEALKQAIESAEKIDLKLYSEESGETLKIELENGRAVLADEAATQAKVDAATENIQKAVEALVKLEVMDPSEPDLPKPDPSEPDLPKPDPSEPDLPKPDPSEPNLPKPDPSEPSLPKPDPSVPNLPKPDSSEPNLPKPDQDKGYHTPKTGDTLPIVESIIFIVANMGIIFFLRKK